MKQLFLFSLLFVIPSLQAVNLFSRFTQAQNQVRAFALNKYAQAKEAVMCKYNRRLTAYMSTSRIFSILSGLGILSTAPNPRNPRDFLFYLPK